MLTLEQSTCNPCSLLSFTSQATGTGLCNTIPTLPCTSLAPTLVQLVDAVFHQKLNQDIRPNFTTFSLSSQYSSFWVGPSVLMACSSFGFSCITAGARSSLWVGSLTTCSGRRHQVSSEFWRIFHAYKTAGALLSALSGSQVSCSGP